MKYWRLAPPIPKRGRRPRLPPPPCPHILAENHPTSLPDPFHVRFRQPVYNEILPRRTPPNNPTRLEGSIRVPRGRRGNLALPCWRRGITAAAQFLQWLDVNSPCRHIFFGWSLVRPQRFHGVIDMVPRCACNCLPAMLYRENLAQYHTKSRTLRDRTRRGFCMSFFNTIGLSKSEALNRVRMNMRWL